MEETPEDRMFEYLLVFEIPEGKFYDQAVSLNELIRDKSASVREKKYRPHLTALLTCLNDSKEGQFIQFIKEVIESISPFDVVPFGIKGFGDNSVIYIDVRDKEHFQTITKKLKEKLNGLAKPFKSAKFRKTFDPRFIRDFHVTVEKDIDEALYVDTLTELKSENHNFENFKIYKMILFKKRLGPYQNQRIAVFEFLGKSGGEYIQGSLFD